MKLPYVARICTAILGEEIELIRLHRRLCISDLDFWTEGRESRCWVEIPTKDKHCITPRWQPPMSVSTVYMRLRRARNGKLHG